MSKRRFSLLFIFLLVFIGSLPWTRVLAEADKTNLEAAYAEIQAAFATPALFDNSSFVAFESDYAALGGDLAVEALIDDPLANQADVDEMTNSLIELKAQLTLHNDVRAHQHHVLVDGVCQSDGLYNPIDDHVQSRTSPDGIRAWQSPLRRSGHRANRI
ncbi:MAG: hypothetical protein MZU97_21430 [Bacillus subtilis]|nr:hypothetical protein [Bacillus subtilis]